MTTLDAISVDLKVEDIAEWERDLKRAGAGVDNFERRANTGLGKVRDGFNVATTAAKAFIAALAVQQVAAVGKAFLDQADDIATTASELNLAAGRYQTLSYALERLALNSAEVTSGLRKFNSVLGEFIQTGSGRAKDTFEALGLDAEIAAGRVQSTEQAFDFITGALGSIQNESERTRAAMELFGVTVGGRFADALQDGGEALNGWEQDLVDAGLVLDDLTLKQMSDANDRIDRWVTKTKAQFRLWAGDVIGYFEGVDQRMALLASGVSLDQANRIIGLSGAETASQQGFDRKPRNIVRPERPLFLPDITVTANAGGSGDAARAKDVSNAALEWLRSWIAEQQRNKAIPPPDAVFEDVELDDFEPTRALDDFEDQAESARRAAEQFGFTLQSAFASALRGSESLLDGIKRLALELLVIQPLANFLSGGVTSVLSGIPGIGGFFGGGRAIGGRVQAGQSYMVGEQRPEIFVPDTNGTIMAGASSGPQYYIDARGAGDPQAVANIVDRVLTMRAPGIIKAASADTFRNLTRPRT